LVGNCRGCALPVKGGTVVELPDGRKWHEACFVCSRCGDSVAGKDKRKKDEGGYIFCAPCHVELYAPACVVCGAKIDGDRINMGNGAYRHPGCKKPPAKKKKAKRRVGPKAASCGRDDFRDILTVKTFEGKSPPTHLVGPRRSRTSTRGSTSSRPPATTGSSRRRSSPGGLSASFLSLQVEGKLEVAKGRWIASFAPPALDANSALQQQQQRCAAPS
jgi:hypothetical protein